MIVAIDIGNTTIGIAFFEKEVIKFRYSTKTVKENTYEESLYLFKSFLKDNGINKADIEGAIISSVVPSQNSIWMEICRNFWSVEPIFVGPGIKTGIMLKVDNPNEVGADLICDLVGAQNKYGNKTIIIDLGTATKYLLLDENGAFSGAVISPGLKLSFKALTEGTACLPEVSLKLPKTVISKNTTDCINSGILYGTVFEIKGFVEAFEKQLGYKLNKVITGGYTKYLLSEFKDYSFEPDLVFEGLRTIYLKNTK